MKLHEALATGLPFKRKEGDGYFITDIRDVILSKDDILGDYWEVQKTEPTKLELKDFDSEDINIILSKFEDDKYHIINMELLYHNDALFTEKDIDQILTFLHDNTEIGRSRIIPF